MSYISLRLNYLPVYTVGFVLMDVFAKVLLLGAVFRLWSSSQCDDLTLGAYTCSRARPRMGIVEVCAGTPCPKIMIMSSRLYKCPFEM